MACLHAPLQAGIFSPASNPTRRDALAPVIAPVIAPGVISHPHRKLRRHSRRVYSQAAAAATVLDRIDIVRSLSD
ncbi:hypothetical protein [Burkholderia savannae]|uniref:hypothetical protein n=1 Tax=Burkholderia savannae TaxID=1637837 RepID=UPI0012E3BB68|nr:hypothetical protein [Burkholderia savannae]